MFAGYERRGAAYMFHSAARMPKEPLREAIAPERTASLAMPEAHDRA
jgi:hypothetical protein